MAADTLPQVITGLAAILSKHRRRLAFLALIVVAVLAFLDLGPRFPREIDLEFELGGDHAHVVELRVAYLRAGEELAGASFLYPKGAPARVRHRVSLPAGKFELRCELRKRDGDSLFLQRSLYAPADGVVRVKLADERYASRAERPK